MNIDFGIEKILEAIEDLTREIKVITEEVKELKIYLRKEINNR